MKKLKHRMLNKKFLGLGGIFFLLLWIWLCWIAPYLLAVPKDFSFKANIISVDNIYDEARGNYSGGFYSKTTYRYDTVSIENDVSEIKNSFEVRNLDDELIFATERLYGIDRLTGQHVKGFGDKDREGYLFAPKNLQENDSFKYWHVNYDVPAQMTFAGIDYLYGLKTMRFESRFEGEDVDQTEDLTFLPQVGVTRGVKLEPYLQIWVEPKTGQLVNYKDDTTAYFYDLNTGERQNPWNHFSNTFSKRSVEESVAIANLELIKKNAVEWYLPLLMLFAALFMFMKGVNFFKKTGNYMNLDRLRIFVSAFIILLSLTSLAGWFLNIDALIRILPSANGMNSITALCFLILGFALIFEKKYNGKLSYFLGMTLVLIGGLRITELIGVVPFSVDLIIFKDAVLSGDEFIARMSSYTAFCFVFLGLVLILVRTKRLRRLHIVEILTSFVFLFSSIALFGHLFSALDFVSIPEFFFTAIHTIILFFISSVFMYGYYSYADKYSLNMKNWLSLTVVLLTTVLATVLIASILNLFLVNQARTDFEVEIDGVAHHIEERVGDYVNVLEAARGLYSASDDVSRKEWNTYVNALKIEENYSGIQGIGYSVFVKPEDLEQHIKEIRAEGFPDFTVKPEGEREVYSSIIYLEPFDLRNQQAFGYDMFSNDIRRNAMERARDTGEPVMSGGITLVQEIDDDVQPGFLIYVPYYKNGSLIDTLEGRRENIVGYIYAPFRSHNFMEDIIGKGGLADIGLIVKDGAGAGVLLYDDTKKFGDNIGRFVDTRLIYVAGSPWVLDFVSSGDYGETPFSRVILPLTIVIGTIFSLMISFVFYTQLSARQKALAYAEEATKGLREAKAKDEAMLNSIGDGFIATDQKGKIILVNKAFQKLTGWSGAEVRGKLLEKVLPMIDKNGRKIKDSERLITKALKTFETVTTTSSSVSYQCKDGSLLPVSITVSPIFVDGRMIGAVEVFRDVTIEKEIDRAKTEFVSVASHELRTPLTAISWYTEMLLEAKHNLSSEYQEYLESIYNSNKRMVKLVNALLDVSRIELGTFDVELEEFNLITLLDSVIEDQKPEIKKRKQKLKTDFPDHHACVLADEKQLRMVFQNLLSNSVKYTKKGGSINFGVIVKGGKVVVTIADTGVGIPKAQQSKIFTKLFRADNVKTMDTVGTGLGLYIVKSIVESNGGVITFKSEEGNGTTFHVTLPACKTRKK